MAQGFDLRHLSRYAQAAVVSSSACAPFFPLLFSCCRLLLFLCCCPFCPRCSCFPPCCPRCHLLPPVASPLCPSAAPALSPCRPCSPVLSPTACSWLGGWPRRMDLGTKECARGASWSNWWHSENDCLCAVYLSVLSPGVFCFAWLVLEAKNGVASVSGLYWPANGFMFSPNVLSLTME